MDDTLERAILGASSGLERAARELNADAVALLCAAGSPAEARYAWTAFQADNSYPEIRSLHARDERLQWVEKSPRRLAAGEVASETLRHLIAGSSRSFLLFQWSGGKQLATLVFGFEAAVPPEVELPESAQECLNFIGMAAWSAREIARLRGELRTVNERLASRKLVERAKGVLQIQNGFNEEQAYEYLRGASRRRRITLTEVASELIQRHARQAPLRCPESAA